MLLLYTLEQMVGDEEVFFGFVRSYLKSRAEQNTTTIYFLQTFKSFLIDHFGEDGETKFSSIPWTEWFYGEGSPPEDHATEALGDKGYAKMIKVADAFAKKEEVTEDLDFLKTSSSLMIEFAQKLKIDHENYDPQTLETIDSALNMSEHPHPEVKVDWLTLCVSKKIEKHLEKAENMAKSIGRMKYAIPLYAAMKSAYPEKAHEVYEANKGFYQDMARY
jgi:hypothetical protein